MLVRRLRVTNLRCLAKAAMTLRCPDDPEAEKLPFPNINLLVGTNGGGKSTVLKAIALAILGPWLGPARKSALPPGLIRRGEDACEIQATLSFRDDADDAPAADFVPVVTRLERHRGGEHVVPKHEVRRGDRLLGTRVRFLAGYGASRLSAAAPRPHAEAPDVMASVRSLLLGDPALTPLESWLPSRGPRRKEVIQLIDHLLPPDTRFFGKREGGRLLFEHRGVEVPGSALSDGYQAFLCWVSDLLCRLSRAAPRGRALTEVPGVVLVDEVDQRLHPRWQQRLVPTIAGTFPRLQFVLTSHSPLLAGNLSHRNLFVMEPDDDAGPGAQRVRQLEEEVFGKTVDRILQGSFFELESTRGDVLRAKLREIAARARKRDPEAAVEFLRTLAGLE